LVLEKAQVLRDVVACLNDFQTFCVDFQGLRMVALLDELGGLLLVFLDDEFVFL
jgi:hypothetical protein